MLTYCSEHGEIRRLRNAGVYSPFEKTTRKRFTWKAEIYWCELVHCAFSIVWPLHCIALLWSVICCMVLVSICFNGFGWLGHVWIIFASLDELFQSEDVNKGTFVTMFMWAAAHGPSGQHVSNCNPASPFHWIIFVIKCTPGSGHAADLQASATGVQWRIEKSAS